MKMPTVHTAPLVGVLATIVAILGVACGASAPAPAQTPSATASVSHKAGTVHSLQPKRLEAVIEIDMYEMYLGNPQGEKNPTFRLPAGKTVGIHIHNEGAIMHELMIGRKVKHAGDEHGYEEALNKLVPSDLFFYYGQTKAEVGDAEFGELEVEPGIRDIWIRMNIPPELKGEWELGCFVEGHYEAGMHARLIIE